jgi:hypothetical protein
LVLIKTSFQELNNDLHELPYDLCAVCLSGLWDMPLEIHIDVGALQWWHSISEIMIAHGSSLK